ncbi:MAG: TetR/AcrR family transcriptional regulator [Chloroflexi bacterium]|nr:TetR/AcrR family transcriptional regulator [Chloroflexota bacterium]
MAKKLGRPSAGQAQLTRERILAIAVRMVDEQGIAALSMHRLATELGVDPMAIYHHLPGKSAVLSGIVEQVFNELRPPAISADAGWQTEVRAYRDLVRAHPNLVLHLVTDMASGGPAILAVNERLYAALASAGLADRMVVQSANLLVDYLNGVALAEGLSRQYSGQYPDQHHAGEPQDLSQLLQRYPSDHFPILRRVLDALPTDTSPDDFERGLDIILAGIQQWSRLVHI